MSDRRPFTNLRLQISKNPSWDAHINKVVETGQVEIGRADVDIRNSHLDTRTITCVLMNVIVQKQEHPGICGRGTWSW